VKQWLRSIPAVHELQQHERFYHLLEKYTIDSASLSENLKVILDQCRHSILESKWEGPEPGTSSFIDTLFNRLDHLLSQRFAYTIKRVINATGTILHTNLGRARLSEEAIKHVLNTAQNYSNLEYILERGSRGSRHSHVEELLQKQLW
jgi:L-seryl-tRNA(Ser) seleniumtransferase